jgi:hypothetical protein
VYFFFISGDISGVSEQLVALGRKQGSADNISVLVVFLKEPSLIRREGGIRERIDGSVFPKNMWEEQIGVSSYFKNEDESEEDFGPETDVDSADDVLLAPSVTKVLGNKSPLPGQTSHPFSYLNTVSNNTQNPYGFSLKAMLYYRKCRSILKGICRESQKHQIRH